jgi:biopolymer transport protein ExbB
MLIAKLIETAGIVAWPLLGFSIIGIALIIERIRFWSRLQTRQQRAIADVLRLYRSDVTAAIQRLKQNADLPISRIFLEALELDDPTPMEFRLALETATQAELPGLKRFTTFFQTIITASPLLGLLGTVLGLIRSFSSLKLGDVSGTSTAGVTAGISEALVSTAMGLVVALTTLLFASAFRGFYLRQLALIQEYCGQLELLYRRLYERGGKVSASP